MAVSVIPELRAYEEAVQRERFARLRADRPCALWPNADIDHAVAISGLLCARAALERATEEARTSSPARFSDDLPPMDSGYLMGLPPASATPPKPRASQAAPRRTAAELSSMYAERRREHARRLTEIVLNADRWPVKQKTIADALETNTTSLRACFEHVDDRRVVLVPGKGWYPAQTA